MERRVWLCWQLTIDDKGALKKVPYNPLTGGHAESDNTATWCDFESARKAVEDGRFESIGIALSDDLGLGIVDFDKVRDSDESMPQWVQQEIIELNSYTEISASGRGAHVLVWSDEKLPNINRQKQHCEIHFRNKMFALSGNIYEGRNTIRKCSLASLHQRVSEGKFYSPGITATIDSQKFLDITKGDYAKYGLGRSEAVMSALVFLAGKHNCDAEKMAGEFETTALCAEWQAKDNKWDRLKNGQLENALKFYRECCATRQYHATETGNAERLVAAYGDKFRYVHDRGKWFAWDGRRWAVDADAEVYRAYKKTVKGMFREAVEITDTEQREAALKWATRSESSSVTSGSVRLAQFEAGVSARSSQFDTQPMLLNVANGTLNLETFTLRPHNPSDNITKLAPVNHDPEAKCATWERFISEILPDAEVREFLKRSLGYSLTGDIGEQCFWLLIGPGKNGKSTLMDVIESLLGDYAVSTCFDVFASRKRDAAISPRDGLASLEGARFVRASESEQERRISAALLKGLTGGEKVHTARMYEQDYRYSVTYKIWLSTNHEPVITDTTEGMWRRIHRINFDVIIPEEKRDIHLTSKLLAEGPGILNWCLDGLRQYRASGLRVPKAVSEATADYRSSQDLVARFLQERCEKDARAVTDAGELYREFGFWAQDNGERAITAKQFGNEVGKRFVRERGCQKRRYVGVRILPERICLPIAGETGVELAG